MCGPLQMALHGGGGNGISRQLLYQSGRIFSYAALGALFAAFGLGLRLAGLQQQLSVLTGLVILAVYFIPKLLPGSMRWSIRLQNLLMGWYRRVWPAGGKGGSGRHFVLGMLNGLLPCGLVYVAVAVAASFAHPLQAMSYMGVFGLGTLPSLLALQWLGGTAGQRISISWNQFAPYLVMLIAALFILRGMDLGIPFISPKMGGMDASSAVNCH